jgi:UDP-glucose 4-epimerase
MNFLVTGGAGFIGSHLVEKLLAEGHNVTVLDNLTTGKVHNLPNHPRLKLLSKGILNCCLEDFPDRFDGLAHLAATPSVTQSWQHPLATHENNLSATVAVLQLCQALEIPRLVFTSSAAVYGNPTQIPIVEDSPTNPISPYGLHKLMGEQYINLFVQQLGQQFGWSAANLRLFNVFGPRQDPNSPYSGVISIFMKMMQEQSPITIYGDGTQTRDFVYVQDVALALFKSLTVPLKAGSCITCNIGTGQSVSLLELVQNLHSCLPDWASDIRFQPARLGDIQHSLADISTAAFHLSFQPQWTLQSGLKHFVQELRRGSDLHLASS